MLAADRDALVCDMAETYHIYDMRALPVATLATLACGLRDDSRIKLKLAGWKYLPPFSMLVSIHDILAQVFHSAKSDTPPVLFADIMTGAVEQAPHYQGFDTVEDFERARARFIRQED